jgi:hypothetical protein
MVIVRPIERISIPFASDQQNTMNDQQINKVIILNLAFWAVAIAFPFFTRILPTGSGSSPKIFEVLVPLFQLMLAGGATYLVKSALEKQK